MRSVVRFLPLVGLLLLGCASMDTPYDAPRVGVDGVAAVLSVERTPVELDYARDRHGEIVVYRVRRTDGRECDLVWAHVERGWGDVDVWFALQHQLVPQPLSPDNHVTIPVCLRVEAIP